MSAAAQTEPDAEYLTRRGWDIDEQCGRWRDPLGSGQSDDNGFTLLAETALTVQTARDEAEARTLWSRCMSEIIGAAMAGARGIGSYTVEQRGELAGNVAGIAGALSDAAVEEYRARFARKVAP